MGIIMTKAAQNNLVIVAIGALVKMLHKPVSTMPSHNAISNHTIVLLMVIGLRKMKFFKASTAGYLSTFSAEVKSKAPKKF